MKRFIDKTKRTSEIGIRFVVYSKNRSDAFVKGCIFCDLRNAAFYAH